MTIAIGGPIHIVTNTDMERLTGIPTPAPDVPASLVMSPPVSDGQVLGFCGEVVSDAAMSRFVWAVSVRALRASPSQFENEPVCANCIRIFARDWHES